MINCSFYLKCFQMRKLHLLTEFKHTTAFVFFSGYGERLIPFLFIATFHVLECCYHFSP